MIVRVAASPKARFPGLTGAVNVSKPGPASLDTLINARGKQLNKARFASIRSIFHRAAAEDNDQTDPTSRECSSSGEGPMEGDFLTLFKLRILWRLMFPDMIMDKQLTQSEQTFNKIDSDHDGDVTWPTMLHYFATRDKGSEDMDVVDLLFEDNVAHCGGSPGGPREWVWALMEQSSADTYAQRWISRACMAVQLSMQLVILTSVVVMMVESVNALVKHNCDWDECTVDAWGAQICDLCEGGGPGTVTFAIEAVCIALFTIEFALRFGSTPSQRAYWTSVWTYIDLISILPFYMDASQAVPSGSASSLVVLRMLRMVKLARVVKMLRLGKNFRSIQVMFVALARAKMALVMMCALMLMTITFFSALMYNVEKVDSYFNHSIPPHGKWVRKKTASWSPRAGQVIFFQSIPEAMWWGLATVTTVGYGDMYPESGLGRFVASMCMVTGILVVAYPITILTNAFAVVDGEFQDEENRKKQRDMFDKRLAAALAEFAQWYGKAARAVGDAEHARASSPRAIRIAARRALEVAGTPRQSSGGREAGDLRRKSFSCRSSGRYSFGDDTPPASPPLLPGAGTELPTGAAGAGAAPQQTAAAGPDLIGGREARHALPEPAPPAGVGAELLRSVHALEETQRAIQRRVDELIRRRAPAPPPW